MQHLFIDVTGTLDRSKDSGLDLAVSSWLDEFIHDDDAEPTAKVIVWSAMGLPFARAAAKKYIPDIETEIRDKADPDGLILLEDLGSEALVVDDDPYFREAAEIFGVRAMTPELFVEEMSGEPDYECVGCAKVFPAPAYRETPKGPTCPMCAPVPSGGQDVGLDTVLTILEDALSRASARLVSDKGLDGDLMEARSALGSVKFMIGFGASDNNVRLVIRRHLERSNKGRDTYGITTAGASIGVLGWLKHHSDELADAEVYAAAAQAKLEESIALIRQCRDSQVVPGSVAHSTLSLVLKELAS